MNDRHPTIGRSGTQLTEVKTRVSLEGPVHDGPPKNSYMDGGKIVRERKNRSVMNLKSTGFGPSKVFSNEKLPKLTDLQKALIKFLDKEKSVPALLLNAWAEKHGGAAEVMKVMAEWIKGYEIAGLAKGNFVLYAEGRRIAALL